MNSIEDAKRQVEEDFGMYEQWLDKYEYLIDLGKDLEPFPEELKTEDRLIKVHLFFCFFKNYSLPLQK